MTMPQYYGPGGGFAAVAGLGQAAPPASAPTAPPAATGTSTLSPRNETNSTVRTVMTVAGTASSAALAYHGYKRNNSVGWAIGWFFLGAFWPNALPVAFAQGFAKPRVKSNGRRRRSR